MLLDIFWLMQIFASVICNIYFNDFVIKGVSTSKCKFRKEIEIRRWVKHKPNLFSKTERANVGYRGGLEILVDGTISEQTIYAQCCSAAHSNQDFNKQKR